MSISNMTSPTSNFSRCHACSKPDYILTKSLRCCAWCGVARYCSRECQEVDWKSHKRVCTPSNSSRQKIDLSHHTVRNNPASEEMSILLGFSTAHCLHKLPEDEALNQLIDCFRMRAEDEYVYNGTLLGIYGVDSSGYYDLDPYDNSPLPDFQKFLDLAESRAGVLPPWWNAAKRDRCEKIAEGHGNGWSNINYAVEKRDIQDHYQNSFMPMLLRILGEKIYGKSFI